jgi:hypothetical protein
MPVAAREDSGGWHGCWSFVDLQYGLEGFGILGGDC